MSSSVISRVGGGWWVGTNLILTNCPRQRLPLTGSGSCQLSQKLMDKEGVVVLEVSDFE